MINTMKSLLILGFLLFAVPAWAQPLILGWTDNSTNEAGFNIDRKEGVAGTFSNLVRVGTGVISYIDTTTLENEEYCYRVNAYNVAGQSEWSDEACATVIGLPRVPSGVTVFQIETTTTIVLTPP